MNTNSRDLYFSGSSRFFQKRTKPNRETDINPDRSGALSEGQRKEQRETPDSRRKSPSKKRALHGSAISKSLQPRLVGVLQTFKKQREESSRGSDRRHAKASVLDRETTKGSGIQIEGRIKEKRDVLGCCPPGALPGRRRLRSKASRTNSSP